MDKDNSDLKPCPDFGWCDDVGLICPERSWFADQYVRKCKINHYAYFAAKGFGEPGDEATLGFNFADSDETEEEVGDIAGEGSVPSRGCGKCQKRDSKGICRRIWNCQAEEEVASVVGGAG